MRTALPILIVLGAACTAIEPESPQHPEEPEQVEPEAPQDEPEAAADARGVASVAARTVAEVKARQTEPEQPPEPECAGEVADPTLLFSESILMRPPVGVEFMPGDNPTHAQAAMSGGFVSACDATIKRVQVFVFANDPAKTLEDYHQDFKALLASSGYTGGTSKPMHHTAVERHVAYEFPAAGGQPASSLYVAARRLKGATVPPVGAVDNVFIVVYESTPEEFAMLEPTFKLSSSSLLVVPP